MNKLLINADDFGLHSSINEAIIHCAENGVVNSISVMPNTEFVDYKNLSVLQNDGIFIGVHLSWLGSKWLTADYNILGWKEFGQKLFLGGRKFMDELTKEAEAQVIRMKAHGIHPDHVDSHQHVHHFPGVWKMIDKIKDKHNIPRIRCCKAADSSLRKVGLVGNALDHLASRHFNADYHYYTTGLRYAGNYSVPDFGVELSASAGVSTELIVHPALKTSEMNDLFPDWNFNWEREYKALLDSSFAEVIEKNNFNLCRRYTSA